MAELRKYKDALLCLSNGNFLRRDVRAGEGFCELSNSDMENLGARNVGVDDIFVPFDPAYLQRNTYPGDENVDLNNAWCLTEEGKFVSGRVQRERIFGLNHMNFVSHNDNFDDEAREVNALVLLWQAPNKD